MKKTLGIVFIVIGGLLLVGNLCIVLFVKDTIIQSSWLAFFSGWVSGIATIFLGIIAVVQNKEYKKENDLFLQRQKEEYTNLINQQTNCTIFSNIMNQRCNYIERVKERLQYFVTNFNFRKITLWLAEMQVEANSNRACDDSSQGALINHFFDDMQVVYLDLIQLIKNDWCESEANAKIQEAIELYRENIVNIKSALNYLEIPKYIAHFNEECALKFKNMLKAKNDYITWLDVDFNMILTTKSGNIDFIKSHYCYVKEQNNG